LTAAVDPIEVLKKVRAQPPRGTGMDGNLLDQGGATVAGEPETAVSAYQLLIGLHGHRARPGGVILDVPKLVESRWGTGHRCLWARGEPFLIVGPDGVGKTTIALLLVLAMIGVKLPSLLGLDVEPVERVLYLACDRPSQAKRSMRRMVTEDDRARLDEWALSAPAVADGSHAPVGANSG
jgi:hypothetical protein